MAYDVSATFSQEQVKLEGTYPVDMYVVNASLSGYDPLYYINGNQNTFGWSVDSSGAVTSNATLYTAIPIQRGELGNNTQGEIGEVTITIPNVDRVMEAIIQRYDYLRGREIYFLTAFARNLPSGSTAYHIGTTPDKNGIIKEKLYIDSVTSDEYSVNFTCRSKFNIKNVVVPRRMFSRECTWAMLGKYTATECDPSNTINTASYPTCDGTLDNCRERNNSGRFGGFPAVPNRGIIVI